MKAIVACGGTGGHTFPGLAVAAELRRRGHDVTVWNAGRDIEASVLKGWDGPTFATGARPLAAKNAVAIALAVMRCRKELKRTRPDALLAMGSYSSLPPVVAAKSMGVPVILHEANTVPGRAVEFLSRLAKSVAISFDVTASYLPGVTTVRTGLPVRAGIADGRRFDFIPPNSFVVFVTGGSQGAHAVNELTVKGIQLFKAELDVRGGAAARPLYVIHQTGAKDESWVRDGYASCQIPGRVHAFEREMASAFASADLVIARAGASTCFELAACAKPALLIPLPTAVRDHQHLNADAFVAKGAADEGIQAKLTPEVVCRYLMDKYDRPERLAQMAAKMRPLAAPDAAAHVADLVQGVS